MRFHRDFIQYPHSTCATVACHEINLRSFRCRNFRLAFSNIFAWVLIQGELRDGRSRVTWPACDRVE